MRLLASMKFRRSHLIHCSLAFAAAIPFSGCTSLDKINFKNPFHPKPRELQHAPLTASTTKKIPIQTVGYSRLVEAAEPIAADNTAQLDAVAYQSEPISVPENQPSIVQDSFPIDLTSALRLTAGQNPQIGYAQQRIQEANAQVQSADMMWLPSMRVGGNYNKHEGRIQDVAGSIIETSRGSIYGGLGAQAVGAGSPAVPGLLMNFHLTDAHFQPLIAQQRLCARRHASLAVRNNLLLDTATAYTNLLEAMQLEAIAEQTLLSAEKLRDITKDFAETGEGLRADADRAVAELSVRQIEHLRAKENVRVASVRLNRLLSQDASLQLEPTESQLVPIALTSPASELRELVALGLSNRPELAESRNLVGEAIEMLNREKYAPLVPSILLGMSYGGNGGGLGSNIDRFGDRMDFDAAAFWELRNLGFGDQAAQNVTRSRVGQARFRQVQMMDTVASEIAEAHVQVQERSGQIELAKLGIQAAQDSYRRNTERIQDGEGLPLEVLQSLHALDLAQRQYVRTIADYNRAQFNLHRALGWPIE